MRANFSSLIRWTAGAALAGAVAQAAVAAAVMPSFTTTPSWTTDRYDPASWGTSTYQGRNDVLGIGINSTTDAANRTGGQSASFYNTQGKQTAISGGAGSILSADLFIESSWGNSSNGFVRTDMWGVMSDVGNAVSDYTIIGFTNYGTAGARLRAWDSDINNWVDLAATIAYGAWNEFDIEFTGSAYNYYVNGSLAFTDNTIAGTTQFSAVIMQAYNFADPALGTPTPTTVPYTAQWSNEQQAVPEPASLALVGAALLGLAATRRKKS